MRSTLIGLGLAAIGIGITLAGYQNRAAGIVCLVAGCAVIASAVLLKRSDTREGNETRPKLILEVSPIDLESADSELIALRNVGDASALSVRIDPIRLQAQVVEFETVHAIEPGAKAFVDTTHATRGGLDLDRFDSDMNWFRAGLRAVVKDLRRSLRVRFHVTYSDIRGRIFTDAFVVTFDRDLTARVDVDDPNAAESG